MKNIKNYPFIFSVIILILLCFTGCDNNDDSIPPVSGTKETSKISVRLSDAPGDYDEVNVEVIDVLIKSDDNGNDENGWVSIRSSNLPAIFNLLDLTGGMNVLIADTLIPAGHLGQMRLLLGEKNNIVKKGISYPLNTPSAQQSGLKLRVNQELETGTSYDFMLDFDVDKSVVKAGNSGNYNLHPVIRVFTSLSLGVITGTVSPVGFPVKASVMVNDEEISSYANDMGVFQINGIPEGTYVVTITPDLTSGYLELIIPNITVMNGKTTNIGNSVLITNNLVTGQIVN